MMWALIRSWHIVDQTRIGFTYCGRVIRPENVSTDAPPPEAKTCESCFRARERRQP